MRTYANFLLFEDVLTNLPPGSTFIKNAADTLMYPKVNIIEHSCGTRLGEVIPLNYTSKGQIELLQNELPLSTARINTLLSQGVTSIRVRTLHSCISKGGVCSVCASSSFGTISPLLDGSWILDGSFLLSGLPALAVGSSLVATSEYIYKTDVIRGDGDPPYPRVRVNHLPSITIRCGLF